MQLKRRTGSNEIAKGRDRRAQKGKKERKKKEKEFENFESFFSFFLFFFSIIIISIYLLNTRTSVIADIDFSLDFARISIEF